MLEKENIKRNKGKSKIMKKKKGTQLSIDSPNWLLIIIVLCFAAFIMVSPQVYLHSVILGNDIMFHFNRFYETYMQIKTGNFNFFQSLYSFQSSGRIITAFYGADFAYLQGLLLIILKSWFKYQLVSSFSCFFIAGASMFWLTYKCKVRTNIGLIIALLYMSSSAVSYYPIAQAFTGWGAALMPLLFVPAIEALKNKESPIRPLQLAIPVTLLLSTHLLSLVIGILAILPFYVIAFINTKNKLNMIFRLAESIGLTMLFSANTIIGFIDVYLSNKILSPSPISQMLSQSMSFSLEGNSWGNYGLVFTAIFFAVIIYFFLNWAKTSLTSKVIVIVGAFFMLLSSKLLPWNSIPHMFKFVSFFQFPQRFSVIAFVLLLLSFALILQESKLLKDVDKKYYILTLLCALFSIFNVYNLMYDQSWHWNTNDLTAAGNNKSSMVEKDPQKLREAFYNKDLNIALKAIQKGTPDYLPVQKNVESSDVLKQNPYELYTNQIINNNVHFNKTVTSDSKLRLTWTNNSNEESDIQLPIIIYNHSTVTLNGKKLTPNEIKTTQIGAAIVTSSPGKNTLVIGYKPFVLFKIAFPIKILSILSTIIYIIYKYKKQK